MFRYSLVVAFLLTLTGCFGDSAEEFLAAAKKELAANNSAAAVVHLKNVLQKNPSSAEARYLFGKALLETGDLAAASIELAKAGELGWSSELLLPVQAELALAMDGPDVVIAKFGSAHPADVALLADLKTTLATAYGMKGDYPAARKVVRESMSLAPKSVRAQLIDVRITAAIDGTGTALQTLQPILDGARGTSDAARAWRLKGDLLQLNQGSRAEALQAFREALKLDPKNVDIHATVVGMLLSDRSFVEAEKQLALMRQARPNNPQWRILSASLGLDKGDLKLASEHAQSLLKMAPDNGRVLYLAGVVAFKQGAYRQAEAHLSKAVSALPGDIGIRLFLAQAYLRNGEADKAVATLKPVVESNASGIPAAVFASLGEAKMQAGDLRQAEEYFKQAVKLNPKDARSRTVLAVSQFEKGKEAQGFDELRAVSAMDSGVVADLALFNASLRKGDAESALRALDAMERKQPKSPMASHLRGKVYISKDRAPEARSAFERSLSIDPKYFPSIAALASMDLVDGKPAQARQRLEAVLSESPSNVKAAMALVNVVAKSGGTVAEQTALLKASIKASPAEVSPRLALIALQIDQKAPKDAVATAQDGVTAMPDNLEMQEAFAQALYQSGELNQALAEYNKVISKQPASPRALVSMAEIYLAQKDYRSAGSALQRALAAKADYFPAQRGLAILEAAKGRPQEALKAARNMQANRSDNAGYLVEGDLLVSKGEYGGAVDAYRAGLEKKQSPLVAIKLHTALLGSGKDADARKFQQDWLRQHPKDVAFLYHLGETSMGAQQFAEALTYFQSVNQTLPNNAPTLNNIAWLMQQLKKDGALDYALAAVKLSPKTPNFLDTLAEVYAGSGQLAKAIETQAAAVALGPDIYVHRLHLARYYVSAGNKSKAKEELQKIAAAGDRFAGQAEVKSMLAGL